MTLKENAGLIKESQLFKIKRNVQESQFLVLSLYFAFQWVALVTKTIDLVLSLYFAFKWVSFEYRLSLPLAFLLFKIE